MKRFYSIHPKDTTVIMRVISIAPVVMIAFQDRSGRRLDELTHLIRAALEPIVAWIWRSFPEYAQEVFSELLHAVNGSFFQQLIG